MTMISAMRQGFDATVAPKEVLDHVGWLAHSVRDSLE